IDGPADFAIPTHVRIAPGTQEVSHVCLRSRAFLSVCWMHEELDMFRVLCCLFSTIAAYAASPLFQTSFEKPNQGWNVVRGAATPDSAVLRGNNKSLRLEGTRDSDALVRFAPVSLTIGKRYELSGWVRTEDLGVRDLDRSPIAAGATLSMAS